MNERPNAGRVRNPTWRTLPASRADAGSVGHEHARTERAYDNL